VLLLLILSVPMISALLNTRRSQGKKDCAPNYQRQCTYNVTLCYIVSFLFIQRSCKHMRYRATRIKGSFGPSDFFSKYRGAHCIWSAIICEIWSFHCGEYVEFWYVMPCCLAERYPHWWRQLYSWGLGHTYTYWSEACWTPESVRRQSRREKLIPYRKSG